MSLLKRLRRQPAPPPPAPAATLSQSLLAPIERVVGASLAPAQLFWEALGTFRPWWPVLIPALLLYARHRYRKEQAALVELALQVAVDYGAITPDEAAQARAAD